MPKKGKTKTTDLRNVLQKRRNTPWEQNPYTYYGNTQYTVRAKSKYHWQKKDDLSHIKIKTLDEIRREKQASAKPSTLSHSQPTNKQCNPENELWNSFKDAHAVIASGGTDQSSGFSDEAGTVVNTKSGTFLGRKPEISVSINNGHRVISTKKYAGKIVKTITVAPPPRPPSPPRLRPPPQQLPSPSLPPPQTSAGQSNANMVGNFKVPPLPTRVTKLAVQRCNFDGGGLPASTSNSPQAGTVYKQSIADFSTGIDGAMTSGSHFGDKATADEVRCTNQAGSFGLPPHTSSHFPPLTKSPLTKSPKTLLKQGNLGSPKALASPVGTTLQSPNKQSNKVRASAFSSSPVPSVVRSSHDGGGDTVECEKSHENTSLDVDEQQEEPHSEDADGDASKSDGSAEDTLESILLTRIKEEPKSSGSEEDCENYLSVFSGSRANVDGEESDLHDSATDDDVLFCVADSGSDSEETKSDSANTNTSSYYAEEDMLSLFAPPNCDDLLEESSFSKSFCEPKPKAYVNRGKEQQLQPQSTMEPEFTSLKRPRGTTNTEESGVGFKKPRTDDRKLERPNQRPTFQKARPPLQRHSFQSNHAGLRRGNHPTTFQQFQPVKAANLSTVACPAFGKVPSSAAVHMPVASDLLQNLPVIIALRVNSCLDENKPCDAWTILSSTHTYLSSDVSLLTRILQSCELCPDEAVPEVAVTVFHTIHLPSVDHILMVLKVLCRFNMVKRSLLYLQSMLAHVNFTKTPAVVAIIDDIMDKLVAENMWEELHGVLLKVVEADINPNDNTLVELIKYLTRVGSYGAICSLIEACDRNGCVPGNEPFMKALRALKLWGGSIEAYTAAKSIYFKHYPTRDKRPNKECFRPDIAGQENTTEQNPRSPHPKDTEPATDGKVTVPEPSVMQDRNANDCLLSTPKVEPIQNTDDKSRANQSPEFFCSPIFSGDDSKKPPAEALGCDKQDQVVAVPVTSPDVPENSPDDVESKPKRIVRIIRRHSNSNNGVKQETSQDENGQTQAENPEPVLGKEHYIKVMEAIINWNDLAAAYFEMRSRCPELIDLDVKNTMLKVLVASPDVAGVAFDDFTEAAKVFVTTGEFDKVDKDVLAYLAVGVLDMCHEKELWTQGHKVLFSLHKNNIYYMTFTLNKEEEATQPICMVLLKSMRVCLCLDLADSALELIQAAAWKGPDTDDHDERLLYFEVFNDLARALMKKKDLLSSWNVIQHLASVNKDYVDANTYSSLLNDLVNTSVETEQLDIALKVHKHMKSNKVAVRRETLSALILGVYDSGRLLPARQLFIEACLEGIYPKQQLHEDPYKVMLVVSFTKIELKFTIEEYLKDLGQFLLYTTSQPVNYDVSINLCRLTDQGEMQEISAGSQGIQEEKQKIFNVMYYDLKPALSLRPRACPGDPCLFATRESIDNWMRANVPGLCELPYIKRDEDESDRSDESDFKFQAVQKPPEFAVTRREDPRTANCQPWEQSSNPMCGQVPSNNFQAGEKTGLATGGGHQYSTSEMITNEARQTELKLVHDYNHGMNNVEIGQSGEPKDGQMYDIRGRISLMPNAPPRYSGMAPNNTHGVPVHREWQDTNAGPNQTQGWGYQLRPMSLLPARPPGHPRIMGPRMCGPRGRVPPFSAWSNSRARPSLPARPPPPFNNPGVSDLSISNGMRLSIVVFRDNTRRDMFGKLAEYVREGRVPEPGWQRVAADLHHRFMEEQFNHSSGQMQYTEAVTRLAEQLVDQYVQQVFPLKRPPPFRPH